MSDLSLSAVINQGWVNGELCNQAWLADRGLAYGDGFFTTVLCYRYQLLNWSAHWQRLVSSAQRLGFPPLNETTLLNELQPALRLVHDWAVIKIMVSRGVGGQGYAPPAQPTIQRLLQLRPAPSQPLVLSELNLILCDTSASINPQLAGLKHLNRLDNVLARQELQHKQAEEGLMFNAFGELVGSTQGNVVLINNHQALTPKLALSGVRGTALSLLQSLDLGLVWSEQVLTRDDVMQAEAMLVCNAVRGIQAVASCNGKRYNTDLIKSIHQAWWHALLNHNSTTLSQDGLDDRTNQFS